MADFSNSKKDKFMRDVEEFVFYIELSEGMDNFLDRIEREAEEEATQLINNYTHKGDNP